MHELAGDGDYELAAEVREQLAAVVRAYTATRRAQTLSGVRLVLARPQPSVDEPDRGPRAHRPLVELVALAEGALVASAVVAEDDVERETAALAARLAGPRPDVEPEAPDRGELALIAAWCEGPDARVRWAEGMFASSITGGATLDAVEQELRRAERAARSDEAVLERRKVRR
jgi:hypothetical protein